MPSVFEKMGNALGVVKKPKIAVKPGAVKPVSGFGAKKGFDINSYMKACNNFVNDFFPKKIPFFFRNIGSVMKNSPNWFKGLPQDEQLVYGVLATGPLFIIVGVVLIFVL
ncbi:hypothetical protein HQ545_08515 [Candidatus Woesearchaeota archaeon]|nr:hypothetical protein [Candidatus Woesearchaeota archaeon]